MFSAATYVQLLGCVWLFATPWTAAHQVPLSFTISQSLLKFMSTELAMLSNYLITCSHRGGSFFFFLQSFPAARSFPMSQLFSSSGESTGASVSASVLTKNIQGWFPLGLIGLITLLPKGLSIQLWCLSITIQNHQLFSIQLLYNPTLTSIHN